MEIPERYLRNTNTFSKEECAALTEKHVCVIGCGGLGGHITDTLCRMGVGTLTVVDGDRFEPSNLNRQLLSDESVLGQSKALTAAAHVKRVNSSVNVIPVAEFFSEKNADAVLAGCDLVMDALDNIRCRRLLQERCEALGIPIVHGAVSGWNGQISVIFPGDRSFDRIYPPFAEDEPYDPETSPGNPSFIPLFVASIQCAEAAKVLLHRENTLQRKLLFCDLYAHQFIMIDL